MPKLSATLRLVLRQFRVVLALALLVALYFVVLDLIDSIKHAPLVFRVVFWTGVLAFVARVGYGSARMRAKNIELLHGVEQLTDPPVSYPSPSNHVVMFDASMLRLWNGDRPLDSLAGADLIVSGADAQKIARARNLFGPYVFDVPLRLLGEVMAHMRVLMNINDGHLTLSCPDPRPTHLYRARLASHHGPGVFNLLAGDVLTLQAPSVHVIRSWSVDGQLEYLDLRSSLSAVDGINPLGAVDQHQPVMVLGDVAALEQLDTNNSRDQRYDVFAEGDLGSLARMFDGVEVRANLWEWTDLDSWTADQLVQTFAADNTVLKVPHTDEYLLMRNLEHEPVAQLDLPAGPVLAVRTNRTGSFVFSELLHQGVVTGLRIHFGVRPSDIYALDPPGLLERVLGAPLYRLRTRLA